MDSPGVPGYSAEIDNETADPADDFLTQMLFTYESEAQRRGVYGGDYRLVLLDFGAVHQADALSNAVLYDNFVGFAVCEELAAVLGDNPDSGVG